MPAKRTAKKTAKPAKRTPKAAKATTLAAKASASPPRTTAQAGQRIYSMEDEVAAYIRMSDEQHKKVLASKQASIDFLVRAGILEPGGKRLAKPYRD